MPNIIEGEANIKVENELDNHTQRIRNNSARVKSQVDTDKEKDQKIILRIR